MQIDDLLKISSPKNIMMSENESCICYDLKKPNLDEDKYDQRIMVYNIKGHESKALTASGSDELLNFTANKKVVFKSNRNNPPEGMTDIFSIPLYGGEGEFLARIDLVVEKLWVLNETSLLILGQKSDPDKGFHLKKDLPSWQDQTSWLKNSPKGLYIYDLKKKDLDRLSPEDLDCDNCSLYTNRACIFTVKKRDGSIYNRLAYINLRTKEFHLLKDYNIYFSFVDFFRGGLIAVGSDFKSRGLKQNRKVYFFDSQGNIRKINSQGDYSFRDSIISDIKIQENCRFQVQDDELYALGTREGKGTIYKISPTGRVTKVLEREGAISDFVISSNKIYYLSIREDSGMELFSYEMNKKEERLTSHNIFIRDIKISPPKSFEYRIGEKKYKAFILLPENIDLRKKYPAVLKIHSGPKITYSNILCHQDQVLTDSGYIVLYCNPPGSDSFGDPYSDIRGEYGERDCSHIMEMLETALKKFPIDKKRLALMGEGYGGFLVNWIIGHDNSFKTAISEASISNWTSFYGTSYMGHTFTRDQLGTDPFENQMALWQKSPLKYLNEIDTPTLFICGEKDMRTPLGQSLEIYTGLKLKGVKTRLLVFPDEGHNISSCGRPRNRINRLKEIINWLEENL